MTYKVVWTERSIQDLDRILSYLKNEWGAASELRFKQKLSLRIDLLSKFPELHKASIAKPSLRLSVLTRQISIVYSFDQDVVQIIRLFDNRSNPQNLI